MTPDGIVLEADEWTMNHLNKLGYFKQDNLQESTVVLEASRTTVTIEDEDTGQTFDVNVEYEINTRDYYDRELDKPEVEIVDATVVGGHRELTDDNIRSIEQQIEQQIDNENYDRPDDSDYETPEERQHRDQYPMHYSGLKDTYEAKYQGREVPLGKPMQGDVKKSKVYVRGPKGNVVKVNFGDPNMKIKKSNPKRRKSFRARHHCENPGPRWKARYWSCRAW